MKTMLGFRPPKDPEAFLAYTEALAGRYDFIELPGPDLEALEGVLSRARGVGYRFTYHARYLDLYPGSLEEEVRRASLRVLEGEVERAARVGAFCLNLHAGNISWTDYPPPGLSPAHEALRAGERRLREAYIERALEAFQHLSHLAGSLGVVLTLENLPAPQELPRSPDWPQHLLRRRRLPQGLGCPGIRQGEEPGPQEGGFWRKEALWGAEAKASFLKASSQAQGRVEGKTPGHPVLQKGREQRGEPQPEADGQGWGLMDPGEPGEQELRLGPSEDRASPAGCPPQKGLRRPALHRGTLSQGRPNLRPVHLGGGTT